jgi:hypothetical protein
MPGQARDPPWSDGGTAKEEKKSRRGGVAGQSGIPLVEVARECLLLIHLIVFD